MAQSNVSSEDRLIRASSRVNADPPERFIIHNTIRDGCNWGYIAKKARDNGVSSLLYLHVKKISGDSSVPNTILEELYEAYCEVTARAILFRTALKDLLKTFANKGIPVLVLKGMALIEDVYPDIGMRPVSDVDILVKEKDLSEVDECLTGMGYASSCRIQAKNLLCSMAHLNSVAYSRRHVPLHVHWHIVNSTVPIYSYKDLDIERFWRDARKTVISGIEARVLAPHHLLIHLSEHMLRHSYDRLIHFCDIHETIQYYTGRGLDWDRLLHESQKMNIARVVYYGLAFTSNVMETQIPEKVLKALRPKKTGCWEGMLEKQRGNSVHWTK